MKLRFCKKRCTEPRPSGKRMSCHTKWIFECRMMPQRNPIGQRMSHLACEDHVQLNMPKSDCGYVLNVRYMGEMRVLGGVDSSHGCVIWLAAIGRVGSSSNGGGSVSPLLCNALNCDICRSNALPSSRVWIHNHQQNTNVASDKL